MSTGSLARTLAGLGFCIASLSASAGSASYSSLVVFGDSLSDSGNNALVMSVGGTQPLPPVSIAGDTVYSKFPSSSGTYTNGPVWTQYLAQSFGLTLLPSWAGGSNYAFAGAQTRIDGDEVAELPGFPFSLRTQVNMYLSNPMTVVDPNGLYVVAGGGNNVRVLLDAAVQNPGLDFQSLAAAAVADYAADIAGMVSDLKFAGARHVLVLNTPNFGLTPLAHAVGMSAQATSLSQAMNDQLAVALNGNATIFDTFSFMTGVVNAGAASGFSNWTNACAAELNGCNVETSLFWDAIHPTTLAHQKLAAAVLVTAVPEPATLALFAAGLAVVTLGARRRASRQQG